MSRVAIIGAGVAGLATALELARRRYEVAVFEAQRAGGGSTWAGAGILYPLLPWHYDAVVNDWCCRGIRLQADWLQALHDATGIDTEHCRSGMRVIGGCGPEALAWLRRHGEPHARDGADLLLPGVAQVRNPRLVDALRAACAAAGVVVHEGLGATAPVVERGGVVAVRWPAGVWACAAAVLCAGAWSGRVEGLAALPVFPVRGQMLALRAHGVPGEIVYQDGRYLVPRRDGVVLIGSTMEQVGFDASTTASAARTLLAWARRIHPALTDERVIRHWAGLRPGSRLNHPLVGPHPELGGLWLNTGHFRYGVTMAPACAQAVSDMLRL